MKQILFCSRVSLPSAASEISSPAGDALHACLKTARSRHSACGVSSLLVRHGDSLLAALEGAHTYVDRMFAALLQDGLLDPPRILADNPIGRREYSEIALGLIEVDTLSPQPAWASKPLHAMDARAARRVLKSLRAFHGLHAAPARESFLHSVQVGSLKA
jgi:hypothetical protein